MEEKQVLITESTMEVLKNELGEEVEELDEEELLQKVQESSKVVATKTETGQTQIRQSLNG
jgi:hypothetical protein